MNNKKNMKGYATVLDDDGINYREIADIMSEIGFVMNHSSARNYILRVMTKFAEAFDREWGLELTDEKIRHVAASPQFQNVISDLLHNLEATE
jgi:hypothetical protein